MCIHIQSVYLDSVVNATYCDLSHESHATSSIFLSGCHSSLVLGAKTLMLLLIIIMLPLLWLCVVVDMLHLTTADATGFPLVSSPRWGGEFYSRKFEWLSDWMAG